MNNLNNRTQASNQRLQNRQQGLQSNINNRTTNMRNNLNARDSRKVEELVDGLSQRPDRPMPTLRPEEPRGGIPAARGYVEKQYQPGSDDGGAGINGPLTETPGERTYHHNTFALYSSDYMLAVEINPLASMTMTDADGREVVLNFSQPPWME